MIPMSVLPILTPMTGFGSTSDAAMGLVIRPVAIKARPAKTIRENIAGLVVISKIIKKESESSCVGSMGVQGDLLDV